ncbi:MAG: universal stress protein [Acidobacteria bacterium]|nr:universal stress protein [Acidobacteriota bacterium]
MKVLVATDFSDASQAALEAAYLLCGRFGATLYILHILEPALGTTTREAMDTAVEEMNEQLRHVEAAAPHPSQPFKIKKVVMAGKPKTAILEYAIRKNTDLIVVGTRGRGALARTVLGSTAQALVRGAECHVLVIKAGVSAPLEKPSSSLATAASDLEAPTE